MARLDQAGRLHVRNGFPHDGAGHADNAHDFRFGRQFVARAQLAVADAVGDMGNDALGQVAVFFRRGRGQGRGHRGRSRDGRCVGICTKNGNEKTIAFSESADYTTS